MFVAQTLLGVAAIAAGGVSWGAAEARAFVVRRATVPALEVGAEPLTVLHLSDAHLVPGQRAKRRFLRSLAELDPDLVVDTGDRVAHPEAIAAYVDDLGPLLAKPGVFVHGSNDYVGPVVKNPLTYFRGPTRPPARPVHLPTARLDAALVNAGWRNLSNSRATLDVGGRVVDAVGLDDPHIDRDRLPEGSLDRTAALRLGVVHAPYRRALDALRADGAELLLAGHTHGGQVRVPLVGALVTNCDLDRRRARGVSGWPGERPDRPGGRDSAWLHVSAGIGTSPFARVRFACRPEATLLTLVARDDS